MTTPGKLQCTVKQFHGVFVVSRFITKTDVLNAILTERNAYPGGSSNLADALLLTRTQVFTNGGDRSFARNVAVLVIGGQPNINDARTVAEAQMAQRTTELYVLGISGKVTPSYIRDLSSLPQTINVNYFMPNSYFDLRNYASIVQNYVCTRQQQGK